jgi:hypothetical protein
LVTVQSTWIDRTGYFILQKARLNKNGTKGNRKTDLVEGAAVMLVLYRGLLLRFIQHGVCLTVVATADQFIGTVIISMARHWFGLKSGFYGRRGFVDDWLVAADHGSECCRGSRTKNNYAKDFSQCELLSLC